MANIKDKITQIRQAIYGKEIRESIASGIESINTEVESTTERQRQVETRQTNLENTFNAEIENAISENPSSAETVAARTDNINNKTYQNLPERLDDFASQLAQKANQNYINEAFKKTVGRGLSDFPIDFFEPPTQTNAYANTQMGEKEFLDTFYNLYVGTHSDGYTVTRTVVGRDESDTYNLYEYVFTPPNYTRTIYYLGGMHPTEEPAMFGLAMLIKNIMKNPNGNAFYRYMRDNVRIVVLPLLNPWGFDQWPRTFGNVNGVNINRNFTTQEIFDQMEVTNIYQVKGSAPFSESETRVFRDRLLHWKDEIEFYFNLHVGNGDWWAYDQFVRYVTGDDKMITGIKDAVAWLDERVRRVYGRNPVNLVSDPDTSYMIRYTFHHMGISGATIEYNPGRYGGDYNGSIDIFYYLMHLSNYTIGALNAFSNSFREYTLQQEIDDLVHFKDKELTFLNAYPTTIFDTFSRADSTVIGKTEKGNKTWVLEPRPQGGISGFEIRNNVLISNISEDNKCTLDAGVKNYLVSTEITWFSYGAIVFRYTDINNYFLARLNNTGLHLYIRQDGVATMIDGYSFTPVVGETYKVSVLVIDDEIVVYLGNKRVINYTSNLFSTVTKVGVRTVSDKATYYNNFVVKSIEQASPSNTDILITLNNGWSGDISCSMDNSGKVSLSGRLIAGIIGDQIEIFNLPNDFYPKTGGQLIVASVFTDGDVPVYKEPIGIFVSAKTGIAVLRFLFGANSLSPGDVVNFNTVYQA